MASAANTAQLSSATDAAPKKKSRLMLVLVAVTVLLAAAGGGAYVMLGKPKTAGAEGGAEGAPAEHGAASEHGDAKGAAHGSSYLALDPAFVVNLDDPDMPRYLQADVQVMSHDAAGLEKVQAQMPRIRNSLLMLFGQQKPADLATREGKEKLQTAALTEVQKIMKEETGKPVVEAVYFTSFVMQ